MLRFRSQLQIDNLPDEQLDNRWEVFMPSMKLNNQVPYIPIVEEIAFAPLGYKKTDRNRAITNYYNVPTDKEDSKEATITFFCDTGMLAQYYIISWRDLIFNAKDEYYYTPSHYKRDIVILFYGLGSATPIAKATLKGCFPLLQNDYQLKYSSKPGRVRITQKFNVDRVMWDSNYASIAVASALVSGSNVAYTLADQAIAHAENAVLGVNNDGTAQDNVLGGTTQGWL